MTTDDLNQQLARYCNTIDTQRALIEELKRDRDAWRRQVMQAQETREAFDEAIRQRDAGRVRGVEPTTTLAGLNPAMTNAPALPHTALRSRPWTPVV